MQVYDWSLCKCGVQASLLTFCCFSNLSFLPLHSVLWFSKVSMFRCLYPVTERTGGARVRTLAHTVFFV